LSTLCYYEFQISDFSEISVDVSTSIDENLSPSVPDPKMVPILKHYIRHNLTKNCLVDTLKLSEETEFATKYLLNKTISEYSAEIAYICYVKCDKCCSYHPFDSQEKNVNCRNCSKRLVLHETNFFVYIPILQQVLKTIEKYIDYVVQKKSSTGIISDVHDGLILNDEIQKLCGDNEILLSFTLNTDGIKMFNNSRSSVWPLQLYQNYIPANQRYIPENIILAGVCYGMSSEINMAEFFRPLCEELNLIKDGFNVVKNNIKYKCIPVISCCTVDLPAKAKVQGFKQYNGKESCGFCYAKGESIKNISSNSSTVRYLWAESNAKLRDHKDTLDIMRRMQPNSKPVHGIKNVPPVVGLPKFNCIRGFSIDYMHCVLIGVCNRLFDLYFCTSNKEYSINPAKAKVLDKRLLEIKPPSEIARKPRSLIKFRADLKANEIRSLLLYYLPVVLDGILPKKYLEHFKILSASIFVLLKAKITDDELISCNSNLKKFVHDFELFYGKVSVTMNVHLLLHVCAAVRDLGPLWTQSAFGFETNNGCLIKGVKGTHNVLKQITSQYILKRKLSEMCDTEEVVSPTTTIEFLGKPKICGKRSVYYRIKKKSVTFTSSTYKTSIGSCDYFMEFDDGVIGKAKYYYENGNQQFVYFEKINVTNEFNQFKEINEAGLFESKLIKDINKKLFLIHVKNTFTNHRQYLSYIPNFFEKT
jgi:hypothetical protein